MVVRWHAVGVTNQEYESTFGKANIHTSILPLQIEFDINEKLEVEPNSDKASYSYLAQEVLPGTPRGRSLREGGRVGGKICGRPGRAVASTVRP